MDYTRVNTEELSFLQQQEFFSSRSGTPDKHQCETVSGTCGLLKSGQCKSQRKAGETLGLGERQSQWLWQVYRQQGYSTLVKSGYGPNFGKLGSWQISQLQHYLRQDQVSRLVDAQHYLEQAFGGHYSVSGLCKLFQRLHIKLKTGRLVDIRHDARQAEAFKKTLGN